MTKTALLYRMVTDKHKCPYGLKAKFLLRKNGFDVVDHVLSDRSAIDAFKQEQSVKTTPQIFIDGVRIGGYSDLREHFGYVAKDRTYFPVVALFSLAALLTLATGPSVTKQSLEPLFLLFTGYAMVSLALLKLQDIESFSSGFVSYDLLAQRFVPYAYAYPFLEALAGILMLSNKLLPLGPIVAIVIGIVGGVSVIYAVWIKKRDIKCACVGGNSKVPLGLVSFLENVLMVTAGIWMLLDWL